MAFNSVTDTIVGTLGFVGDLRELANDNAVINFSLAVTPRKKQGKEWVDDETIWTNVVVWGRDARAFANNQFAKGTQLVVVGTRRAVRRDAYTSKDGKEVPERVEQEVNAQLIAVAVNPFTSVTVTRITKNGNGTNVPANNTKHEDAPAKQNKSAASDQTVDDVDPFAEGTTDPFNQTATDGNTTDGNTSDTKPKDSDDPWADVTF